MNMFNSDQKRTLAIAGLALLIGFLMSLSGCDGSGEPTNDGGVPTSVLLPDGGINPKMNPCGTAPGCTISTCGWDVKTGKCWSTPWCEPSVPVNNIAGKMLGVRPASAICDDGVNTYTYQPDTIMVWGSTITGSDLTDTYTIAHAGEVNGFVCVPNGYYRVNC